MPKIGRNDPCPCGSGKKYKKCCMGKGGIADRKPNIARQSAELPDITSIRISPYSSSRESALYDAFDEIVELEKADRVREAARKYLMTTADMQEVPDDFYWDVSEIGFSTAMKLRRDDPDQCIRLLQRAALLDPPNATNIQRDIGEIMIEKGDVQQGFSLLHRLTEENPYDIWCWITLGRNYVDTKDYEKAEEYLQRAIQIGEIQKEEDWRISEDIGTVYIHLFDVYRATGRIEDAIQAWREAASHDDLYISHVEGVCDMLIDEGDLERAYQFAEEMQHPIERSYYLGRIRSLQGDEEAALAHWNAGLREANYDHPQRWPEIALRLGKYDLVIQKMPSLVDQLPQNPYRRILLSLAYIMDSDMKSARKVLKAAPKILELPDDLRKLCEELPLDDQIRAQWLECLALSATPDAISQASNR
jgi:tetratricopeptide (TPR) repeat protein